MNTDVMQDFKARFPGDPFVRAIWCRSERLSENKKHQIEPDANCDFIFSFSEEGDMISAFFAGFDTVAQPLEAGSLTYVGLQFQPQAAASLISAHMTDCVNQRLPLSDVLSGRHRHRWTAFERFSRSALAGSCEQALRHLTPLYDLVRGDPLMDALHHVFQHHPSLDAIAEVADDQGYSLRTLERRTHEFTGLAPRELLRIYRFIRARKLYRKSIPLADLALLAGFADQAHMSREFRRIVGKTPSQYFRKKKA